MLVLVDVFVDDPHIMPRLKFLTTWADWDFRCVEMDLRIRG
jgi:hypothetical protein